MFMYLYSSISDILVCVCVCVCVEDPKVLVMVGISFGLLCVLQSVLNISLRLQSGEYRSS